MSCEVDGTSRIKDGPPRYLHTLDSLNYDEKVRYIFHRLPKYYSVMFVLGFGFAEFEYLKK